MANPCILTFRGKEYTYNEWIEYLSEGGLDGLISEGELKGIKPISEALGEISVGGKSFNIATRQDVYQALKDLGYDDELAKANADLMEMAAEAASKRYGIRKEDYYNMTIRNYSRGEEEGLQQMDLPDGRRVTVKPVDVDVVNGFYSPIEKRLVETKIDKQSANKWLSVIGKGDEAEYTGVRKWLESKNPKEQVFKAEIQQWMKDNRIGAVEVVKQDSSDSYKMEDYENFPQEVTDVFEELGDDTMAIAKKLREIGYEVDTDIDGSILSFNKKGEENKFDKATKFSQYQLEGEKENYKELLVTLPKADKSKELLKLDSFKDELRKKYGNDFKGSQLTDTEIDNLQELKQKAREEDVKFKSSHFDEPNILVHLRMNTRTDANGSKVLFLEEVQSDWGQKGKKEGFKNTEKDNELKRLQEEASMATFDFNQIEEELDRQYKEKKRDGESRSDLRKRDSDFNKLAQQYLPAEQRMLEARKAFDLFQVENRSEVPPAPFVTDTNAWTKLGLKFALREAVKQGADKIAWTTGEQQVGRYENDFRKQVDKIETYKRISADVPSVHIIASKGSSQVFDHIIPINGKTIVSGKEVDLEDVVGKEIANKIRNSEEKQQSFEGDALTIGGKGMEDFYGKPSDAIRSKNFTIKKEKELFAVTDENGKTIRTFKQENEAIKFKENYGLGIVGNVAKSLFKQKPKTTNIDVSPEFVKDNLQVVYRPDEPMGRVWLVEDNQGRVRGRLSSKEAAEQEKAGMLKQREDARKVITQHSIDITPELKAEVEKGLPLFQTTRGRFSVESGKDVVELLKSRNASTFPHELAHKHLQTIIDFAKSVPSAMGDLQTLAKEFVKQKGKGLSVDQVISQLTATDKALMDNATYREVHEFFANGFEKWLKEGDKAGFSEQMVELFKKFQQYLIDVYNSVSDRRLADIKLSPELNKFYNDIFGADWQQVKAQEKEAKKDIEKKEVSEAIKEDVIKPEDLMGFFKQGEVGLQQAEKSMLNMLLRYAKGLFQEGDIDQFNWKERIIENLKTMEGAPKSKIDEAIRTIEEHEDAFLPFVSLETPLRQEFINALQSKEVTDEEKRQLRKGDVGTYVKVSLNKLNKKAEDVIKTLTFDEAVDMVTKKIINIDFTNDEELSSNAALLAAVINKGKNERKGVPDSKKEEYTRKMADLYEQLSVFGTIVGKGLNAFKLMTAVDPNWFVSKLRKEYDTPSPGDISRFEKRVAELKQQVKELDTHNSSLLFELAVSENQLANMKKELEKAREASKREPKEQGVKIEDAKRLTKEQLENRKQKVKAMADLLKKKMAERGLTQDDMDEMSESELIHNIAEELVEIELQETGKSVSINKFAKMIRKNFGNVDYDLGAIYKGISDKLSKAYGENAFSNEQEISDFYADENRRAMEYSEKESQSKLDKAKSDEVKTLRKLMQANKQIFDAKINSLADFAKSNILKTGLWGDYLAAYANDIVGKINANIEKSYGVEAAKKPKAMLDDFSRTLAANIKNFIDERLPVEGDKAQKVDYTKKLQDISANKEKFQQMFDAAINSLKAKFGNDPMLEEVTSRLSLDKEVFSSKFMKNALFDEINNLGVNIKDFILMDGAEKQSITDYLVNKIGLEDTALKNSLRTQLQTIEADLFSSAKNSVADRITNDIKNEVKGYTDREVDLMTRLKNNLVTQFKDAVKDKRTERKRTEQELLADALNEAMDAKGREIFGDVKQKVLDYIESRDWSEQEKSKAREFIKDYETSVFHSLVTAKVGNKVINEALKEQGYVRKQIIKGQEKEFPDWKGLVTDLKLNKENLRDALAQTLYEKIGDRKLADNVISHIIDMYDMRVAKESERYIAGEIAKIAAKNDITTTKAKITSKLKMLMNISNALDGLDNQVFKDYFAEEFGLKKISDAQAKHLEDLLERVQIAPKGIIRDERAEVAAAYVDFLKSRSNFIAAQAFSNAYSSVLAHPTTLAINAYSLPRTFLFAAQKMLFDKNYAKVLMRSMSQGVFRAGVLEGRLNVPEDYAAHTNLKYRPEEVLQDFMPTDVAVIDNIKKGKMGKAIGNAFLQLSARGLSAPFAKPSTNALTFLKVMNRIANATDALTQQGMGALKAYEFLYKKAIESGKTKQQAQEEAYKKLFPMDYSEAALLAEEEYKLRNVIPTPSQIRDRANEIIRQKRSEDINALIERIGFTAAMRNKPEFGLSGGIFENAAWALETTTSGLLRASEKKPYMQKILSFGKYKSIPFVRTVGHVLDRGLDATGLGILRGGARYLKNVYYFDSYSSLKEDVKKGKLTRDEGVFIEAFKAQRSIGDAFLGFALVGTLQMLISQFGDDDDGFYGNNEDGGEIAKQKGLRNVVRINGHNIPVGYFGIFSPAVIALGNAEDYLRNHKKKAIPVTNPKKLLADYDNGVLELAKQTAKSIGNLSFLSSVNVWFRDDMKSVSKMSRIMATDLQGALGIPHRFLNDVYGVADRNAYESYTVAEGILKAMPYLSLINVVERNRRMYDYRGRYMTVGQKPGMSVSSIIDSFSAEKGDDIDRFFVNNKLNTPDPAKTAGTYVKKSEGGVEELANPDYEEIYSIYLQAGVRFNMELQSLGLKGLYDQKVELMSQADELYSNADIRYKKGLTDAWVDAKMQEFINKLWKQSEAESMKMYGYEPLKNATQEISTGEEEEFNPEEQYR